MKTVFKIAAGIILALVVVIGGCAALIGAGVNEAEDDAQEHAITKSQFDSIDQGSTQSEVEKELGDPSDDQEFESRFGGKTQGSSCIYYNEKGAELFEGDSYQFCFTNEKLDSKNVY